MAIFTSVANYLKCRYYFESVLGFRLIDKYPDESQSDYENDISGFTVTGYTDTPDTNFGIFCRRSNRIIARNIWFLYGKSTPWNNDQEPPKETEVGFVIKNDDNEENDVCGFILDPIGSSYPFDFIGMKRLLPVTDDGTSSSPINDPEAIFPYKDIVQFTKIKLDGDGNPLPPEKLSNYDMSILPQNGGSNGLNEKKPNSLIIKSSYDYDDFGFNEEKREYNIRQIGMMTNLHVDSSKQSFIAEKNTLYNGISPSQDSFNNLNKLLNITQNSLIIPNDLVLEDRFTSVIGTSYTYPSNFLSYELRLGDGNGGVRENKAVVNNNSFFGILQFYINTLPNNRITFQTDTYNFILSFENQIKCTCTCDNCNYN